VIHTLREPVLAPSQLLLLFCCYSQLIILQVLKCQINKLITISTRVITLSCHLSFQTLQNLTMYVGLLQYIIDCDENNFGFYIYINKANDFEYYLIYLCL